MLTPTSQFAEFKKTYKRYAECLLASISKRYEQDGFRRLFKQKLRFYGHNWTIEPYYVDGYEQYIPWHDDELFRQPEAESCMKEFVSAGLSKCIRLSNNDGVPVTGPSFETLSPFIAVELTHPIRHLIRKHRTTRLNNQQIQKCLDQYIAVWLGQSNTQPRYAPIYNFRSSIQSIKLNEFVSIVPFIDEKKTELFEAVGPLGKGFDIQSFAEATHVAMQKAVGDQCNEKRRKEIDESCRKALQAAITSLRLIKSEMVGTTGFIRITRISRAGDAGFSPLESYDIPMHSIFRGKYEFDPDESRYFRRIYRMLSHNQFTVMNRLKLPLQQFNRSCQRQREEDKILDYTICLESTLLGDLDDELSYRLALRAAKLLRSSRRPSETFEVMRCLYKLRSAIVHSNESWGSPKMLKTIKKLNIGTHDYMRSLDCVMREMLCEIIRSIHEGNSIGSLCKRLDTEIVEAI